MASSWMIRNRSLRSKGVSLPEDCYRLDVTKTAAKNAYDIYYYLASRTTNDNKRLSLLNAYVKLISNQPKELDFGFTTEDFLYCISASLTNQLTQIRAASLRAIRNLLHTPNDLKVFNGLQLPHLVCRSLDILLKNEEERVQALKLIRRMLAISADLISPVLVRCLVALGESGVEDGDRMLRACLATLCEFGVLNPTILIVCGGVNAITRNVLECHSPRIAESLCGVLLHLLEWPHTRHIAGVRLDCLAAPYCDFTYRLGIMDKNKDARDLRFTCSRLALLSVLKSWAGTIEFCDPNKSSGLKAIVDVLYLNQLEVRKAILDLLYELLGLPQPVWTDEYSVALAVVDPADFQDSWRLGEGFVANEGRFVLPSLASRVPNVCDIHLAVLLYCFLETGLLNALVEVIISSDTFISVRATVLLGKLLQLNHNLLPADICSTSHALPTLITRATEGNHQARSSIAALQSYHQMLKNRPASCSLFLDSIIQSGSLINTKLFRRDISSQDNSTSTGYGTTNERHRLDSVGSSTTSGCGDLQNDDIQIMPVLKQKTSGIKRNKILQFFDGLKESERLIRLSSVLLNQDGSTWDWDIIITILKSDTIVKMDDSQLRFIKRLIHYFKPSSNRFSHQDMGHGRHIPSSVLAGVELIDWLINSNQELEALRLLFDLFSDISSQLLAISSSRSAHDCLFSPQHMGSTMCQQYFLFIGRMCKTEKGLNVLKDTNIFKQLEYLILNTNHVCYIKLIVSGLDYSMENSLPRIILEKALQLSPIRAGRCYATQLLLILLRSKVPNFEVWGLPLLIKQTMDEERSVVLTALEILDESCHEKIYLEELVNIWPDLERKGDAGKLIVTRFYSIPRGINHTKAKMKYEIEYWTKIYNKKYVLLIEADTHASMTLHSKNEDGSYNRRSCSSRPVVIPPNILPHLYGQLVQTTQGMTNLLKYGNLPQLIDLITLSKCSDESESLILKSAIWALAHTSTSTEGVEYLNDPISRLYEKLIFLVKFCDVYSIRATALNALALVGSTNAGANVLFKLDWFCVRHDRSTNWPVSEPEDWLSKHLTPVRHHQINEVAPYNYTGLEENISGTYDITDGTTSFYYDESSGECSRSSDKDTEQQQQRNGERSRTLPESSIMRIRKHTGSLSESKTTDGISLSTVNNQQHTTTARTRFNSGTDSNTSGVSSCDSIFNRIILSDLQQTLSPIPSSSNLLEQREHFRRIPLREATLSPQDLQGYATLRSLRRHCRPMLSESAADELADIIESNSTTIRSKKNSINEQRKLKVRSLDRHCRLFSAGVEEFQQSANSSASYTRVISQTNDFRGPCYSGICLPKNINDLFPHRSTTLNYVTRYIQDDIMNDSMNLGSLKQQFQNDSIIEGDESCLSSLSDISITSKRTTKWTGRHNRTSCLYCCRSKINRLHPRTDSDINIQRRKSSSQQHHSSSIQLLSDVSFNSPESVFSEESMPDRITTNILRHVQRMANPVWSKQLKISLLELKQKHPHSFQDICLYSEVCKSLGKSTYRLNARRFLQELFLDLDFDSFFNEANEIINRKCKEQEREQEEQIKNISGSGVSGDNKSLILKPFLFSTTDEFELQNNSSLKSPQLSAVYEASAENLSEDMLYYSKMNSAIRKNSFNSTTTTTNNDKNSVYPLNVRPRFNTLELDLRCSKNKFPITERRKTFSPTTTKAPSHQILSTSCYASIADTESLTATTSSTSIMAPSSLYCEKYFSRKKEK